MACTTVQPERLMMSARRYGSRACSRLAITTLPPVINGRNSSNAAISKEIGVKARKMSSPRNPGVTCVEINRLTKLRWEMSTAFGFPVVPEV